MFFLVSKADICGTQKFIAEEHPQNFSTPRYPLPYLPQGNCNWNITTDSFNKTIVLVFFVFDLSRNDRVKITEVSIYTQHNFKKDLVKKRKEHTLRSFFKLQLCYQLVKLPAPVLRTNLIPGRGHSSYSTLLFFATQNQL